ncbi:MAG: hypothetical protein RI932_1513, partial [Pseudomonadota bacterium]
MFFISASVRQFSRLLFLATGASSLVLLGGAPTEIEPEIAHERANLSGEFLVKVKSSSQLLSFARDQNLLVVPQPLLKTEAGLWFKIVDTNAVFDETELEQHGLESGIIHVERNLVWRSIDSLRGGGGNSDSLNPAPENPPSLPRRPRRDPQNNKVWALAKIGAP